MDSPHQVNLGLGARLPMIFQTEAAECGLACLAMVSGYFSGRSDLRELRRDFSVSMKGTRLKDMVGIAHLLDLSSRPLRLELDEIDQLQCPCVLHWDLNHFVVLREVRRKHVVVHDPASGIRKLTREQLSEHFSGVALELSPNAVFQPAEPAPALRLRQLFGRVVGLKRSLGQVLVIALTIELLSLAQPLMLQWVVDNVIVSADLDLLITLSIGFVLLTVLQVIFTTLRGWMLMTISASMNVQSSGSLYGHLQNLPATYFETRHLGDIVSRFASMETIQKALTTDLVEVVLDGLFAVLTLVMMLLFSPLLTAVVVGFALLYGLLRVAMYPPLRNASLEHIVWDARKDNHFLESMRAVRTIKLMLGQETRRAQWLNLLVESLNRQLTTQKLTLLFRGANGLLLGVLGIVVIGLAASQVIASTLTVGAMLAFISYKNQFVGRITALIDRAVELRMLNLHAERLADIALSTPESSAPRQPDVVLPGAIELRGVRFRYGTQDPWVLDGIDLSIEAGESVAIVGPSGCGKTTLLKILASLAAPTEGQLRVGREPIAHWGLNNYRAGIGVVLQDDQLLSGSIADNICFFAARPDRARIERAARLAAVHTDIAAMPMGYESLIGDMGSSVSGGQKQRILLARALYRQPRILLLDEATSHLDVALERAVNDAVRQLKITRIVVAHRPETIRAADRVITLAGGRVVSDVRQGRAVDAVPAPALTTDDAKEGAAE